MDEKTKPKSESVCLKFSQLQCNVPHTSGCWSSLKVSVLVAGSVGKDEKMTKGGGGGGVVGWRNLAPDHLS